MIVEGQSIVRACIRRDRPGLYQRQAAIQAVHCDAPTFEATDWPRILKLYDHLYALSPTPLVAINRATVIGEVDGPDAGLATIESVDADLSDYLPFHAARAALLRRLRLSGPARAAYKRAYELATSETDRQYFASQLAALHHET